MTTATLAAIVLIGGFIALMLMRVPVSFAMLLSTLGCALVTGTNLSVLVRQMVDGVNNFSLLSIPFFILMGEIMGAGGISDKIIDLANLAVGRFHGGLAYVNCLSSMFFGGISGSAVADVSSLGSVVIPMMVKQGYTEDFSVGLTVTTACQGVLIPPSHNMVIYALAAGGGVSIGSLFMAGAVPGIVLGCAMMALCFFMGKKYNFPKGVAIPKEQRKSVILRGILPMLTLVIILVLSLGTDISGTVQNDYNLLELIPYLIVLVGGIVGINVFIVLLLGILSGSIIVVAEGAVAATDLLGNMGTGAAGMFETTMVAVLVSAICALIRENGGFVALLNGIKRLFRSRKGGQLGMGLLVGAMDIATANNTVAIVMANPIAHEMAETYNVSRRKTASILDTFSCVFQGVIPYGAQMLVAISACTELGFQVSAFQIMPFLFYPFFLLLSSLVFIFFVPDDRGYVPDHAAYHSSSS